MANIFNLFLFLLLVWSLFLGVLGEFSWAYFLFGVLSCIVVSAISYKLKIINKKFLYFNFGFYRHFIWLYVSNFFNSIRLIFLLAFSDKQVKPLVCKVNVDKENLGYLIASLDLFCGILFIDFKNDEALIHAVNKGCFEKIDLFVLKKNVKNLDEMGF